MAINPFMKKTLKAISYADINLKKNYRLERIFYNLTHPTLKLLYKMLDHKICADGHDIPVRIFMPKKQRSDDLLLFFHGGGWVTGNIDSYSTACAAMAKKTGRRVISVDYRLAPENPFPCGLNDCYLVARELSLHLVETEVLADYKKIILVGDSAGGNLSAVVSLMAADKGEFNIKSQVLIYPSTYFDHSKNSPFKSMRTNGEDYLVTSRRICDFMDLYIPDIDKRQSPYFAPLLSEDLYGQPRTLIITAEYDPLRDEGEAYGEKLKMFGNDVTIYRMKDALHGFFSLPSRFAHVKKCFELINEFLDGEDIK